MINKDDIGIIWFIFLLICIFIGIAKSIVKRIMRDTAAHKVLDNSFDYEKEKADVLAINKRSGFKKDEVKKMHWLC